MARNTIRLWLSLGVAILISLSFTTAACNPAAGRPPTPVGTSTPAASPTQAPKATSTGTETPAATPRQTAPAASPPVVLTPVVPSPVPPAATEPGGAGPTAVSGTTPGTPTPIPPGGQLTITLADQGKTIELQTGQRFLLDLGEGYNWTVEIEDTSVVSRVVNITVVRGAQGVFEARRPGHTTLTAIGDPPCRSATPPCGAPSRLFRVDLNVR